MTIAVIGHHLSVPGTELYWKIYSETKKEDVIIIKPKFWKEFGHIVINTEKKYGRVTEFALVAPFSKQRKQNLYFFVNILRLIRILTTYRPRYVYIMNTSNSMICLQASVLSSFLGIKTLGWASRLEARNFFTTFGVLKGIIFSVVRILNQQSLSAIHATSDMAKRALCSEGHNMPIFVAPTHGIPAHFIGPFTRRLKADHTLKIGFVGELRKFKGVDVLLSAMEHTSLSHLIEIVGIGPETGFLQSLAKEKNIEAKFWGAVRNEKMPDFYDSLDVLVLPSTGDTQIIEKFGRVLIEAASRGCAVVGSDVGGISMAIGPDGLTFPDRDFQELAKIINELSNPKTLLRRQKMCFDFAVKKYSMSSVVQEFIDNVDGKF
jgi:glycosyltransferase involved in cell wall biosynthesis